MLQRKKKKIQAKNNDKHKKKRDNVNNMFYIMQIYINWHNNYKLNQVYNNIYYYTISYLIVQIIIVSNFFTESKNI